MQTLDSYRSTHVELRHMIEDLRAILTLEQLRIRANAKSAYELLCDLGERVHRQGYRIKVLSIADTPA
jgi:hypothetical protein